MRSKKCKVQEIKKLIQYAYIHTYIHTHIHAHIQEKERQRLVNEIKVAQAARYKETNPICIHTYIHTYIHTIHVHIQEKERQRLVNEIKEAQGARDKETNQRRESQQELNLAVEKLLQRESEVRAVTGDVGMYTSVCVCVCVCMYVCVSVCIYMPIHTYIQQVEFSRGKIASKGK
jgi:hypothetical protein